MGDEPYYPLANGIGDDGEPSWVLSRGGFPKDSRPWWRRILNLCRPGDRHDWHPEGFADWRCPRCGAFR